MRKPMMGSHDLSKLFRTRLVNHRCLFEAMAPEISASQACGLWPCHNLLNLSSSILCLVLLGLMGNLQNWRSRRDRWWKIIDQSQPKPIIRVDAQPCSRERPKPNFCYLPKLNILHLQSADYSAGTKYSVEYALWNLFFY